MADMLAKVKTLNPMFRPCAYLRSCCCRSTTQSVQKPCSRNLTKMCKTETLARAQQGTLTLSTAWPCFLLQTVSEDHLPRPKLQMPLCRLLRRWRYPMTCHGRPEYVEYMARALEAGSSGKPPAFLPPLAERPIDVAFSGCAAARISVLFHTITCHWVPASERRVTPRSATC